MACDGIRLVLFFNTTFYFAKTHSNSLLVASLFELFSIDVDHAMQMSMLGAPSWRIIIGMNVRYLLCSSALFTYSHVWFTRKIACHGCASEHMATDDSHQCIKLLLPPGVSTYDSAFSVNRHIQSSIKSRATLGVQPNVPNWGGYSPSLNHEYVAVERRAGRQSKDLDQHFQNKF